MAGIRVELEYSDGSFQSGIIRAGQTLDGFKKTVDATYTSIQALEGGSRSFLQSMRDVTVIMGQAGRAMEMMKSLTTGWAQDIINTNSQFERMGVLMRGLSREADTVADATKQVQMLRDMAKSTPFSLEAITDVFVKMRTTGIEPTILMMKGLTDAVAASGGTEAQLKHAGLAIQEMAGKGVIEMKELRNQLGIAMPRAVELMARSMGVSYGELIAMVNTGTLDAKSALAQFAAELERTFGGAAQAQMQTYNGQVKLLATNLQNLQLKAGESGFFEVIKKELMQINQILGSSQGEVMARMLGAGLSYVVGVIHNVVTTLFSLRAELVAIGVTVGLVFGANIAGSLIQGFISWLANLRSAVTLTRAQFALFSTEFASFKLLLSAAGGMGTNLKDTMVVAAAGVGALRVGFMSLLTTISTMAPYIALLVGVVAYAATTFDFFGVKTKLAWQELARFGAVSREALKLPTDDLEKQGKYVDSLRQKVEDLRKKQEDINAMKDDAGFMGSAVTNRQATNQGEIDRAQARLNDAMIKFSKDKQLLAEATTQVELAEAQKIANVKMGAADQELALVERNMDASGITLQKRREAARNEATLAHRDTEEINKKFADEEKQRQLSVYQSQIDINQKYLDAQIARAASLTGVDKEANDIAQGMFRKRIVQNMELLETAKKAEMGMKKTDHEVDLETLLDRGRQALLKLKGDISGSRAELAGASNEVEKLVYLMQNGKFGPAENSQVKALTADIIAAKKEAEALDEMLKGTHDATRDIDNAIVKLKDQSFEALNGKLDDADKIRIKFGQGLYKDLTLAADGTVRFTGGLRQALAIGQQLGQSLGGSTGVFGSGVQDQAKELTTTTERFAKALADAGLSARGINLPNMNAAGISNFGVSGPRPSTAPVGDERELFIRTLIGEGGSQGEQGMAAIASVIMNRLAKGNYGGSSLDGVIRSPKQFSMWNPGDPAGPMAMNTPVDSAVYKRAAAIVDLAMSGKLADPTNGADHYYNPNDASPAWGPGMTNQNKIGSHLFGNTPGGSNPPPSVSSLGFSTSLTPGITQEQVDQQISLEETLTAKMKALNEQSAKTAKDIGEGMQRDKLTELTNEELAEELKLKGTEKREAQVLQLIKNGKVNKNDIDPESDANKKLLEEAAAIDILIDKNKRLQEIKTKSKGAQEAFKTLKEQQDVAQADANAQLADPLGLKYDAGLEALKRANVKRLSEIEAEFGRESDVYKDFAKTSQALEDQAMQISLTKKVADGKMKTAQLMTENMTDRERNTYEIGLQIRQQQELLDRFKGTEEEKLKFATEIAARMAALQQELARKNESAVTKMMRDWKDIGKGIENVGATAINGLADSLADFVVTGKANFKQLADSILKDLARVAIKWAMSGLTNSLGMGGGGAAKTGGSAKLASVATAHTGGIIGLSNLIGTSVHPGVFAGAPRFHSGGVVGGLSSGEVPIIAKQGEGVFTQEQMANLGGQVISLAPTIHVNANGGTKDQNEDLARQTANHVQSAIRSLVVDELKQQLRPGNMLGR